MRPQSIARLTLLAAGFLLVTDFPLVPARQHPWQTDAAVATVLAVVALLAYHGGSNVSRALFWIVLAALGAAVIDSLLVVPGLPTSLPSAALDPISPIAVWASLLATYLTLFAALGQLWRMRAWRVVAPTHA